MNPIVRPATPDDVEPLAALKLRTFRETFLDGFCIPYPPADLAAFEEASYAPAAVAREMADGQTATWVTEDSDRRLLGYARVGPCKLPHPEVTPDAGELYQLYVLKDAQGFRLGARLLEVALDHLAVTRPGPIWLGVWSGNEKAQAVYARRGFAKVGEYEFPVGTWRDHEFIFRRDPAPHGAR